MIMIKISSRKYYDMYYVASTKVYSTLSLRANGILDLSKKDSFHKDLLGRNVFIFLRETYPTLFHVHETL